METKEMKAEISKKIRKGILIAFIVYEAVILLLGILGFVVGIDQGGQHGEYVDYEYFRLNWWFFLRITRYWNEKGVSNDINDINVGNIFLAIFIILFLMVIPVVIFLIENRRRKLIELATNEKEIVGFYTAFIPISKIALKMPIDKVDNITVVDNKLHLFTGKTIRISSTSGVIKIPYVLNADEIVAFISEAIEKTKGSQKQAQPVPLPQTDATDSLKKLAELRDAGIITEEEFNQKKNELLGKI